MMMMIMMMMMMMMMMIMMMIDDDDAMVMITIQRREMFGVKDMTFAAIRVFKGGYDGVGRGSR